MSHDDTEDTTVTRRLPSPVKMEGFLLMMKCKHLIEILWEEHLFTLWGKTSVPLFVVFRFEGTKGYYLNATFNVHLRIAI